MAKALTYRQQAKMAAQVAKNNNRLAKLQYDVANAMPQTNQSDATTLLSANAAWDVCARYRSLADSADSLAADYTKLADDAYAAGDTSEAP